MTAVTDVSVEWDTVWRNGRWSISQRTVIFALDDGSEEREAVEEDDGFSIFERTHDGIESRSLDASPAFVQRAYQRARAS